ncbi:serine racemase [Iris pallida]|uniref:Serine racemase n=1 Tax=Iris pallida TaxID=29817 RepID=A0AAX6I9L2_IRIPA|nr:serine racemase [Iris pallida]
MEQALVKRKHAYIFLKRFKGNYFVMIDLYMAINITTNMLIRYRTVYRCNHWNESDMFYARILCSCNYHIFLIDGIRLQHLKETFKYFKYTFLYTKLQACDLETK